MDDNTKEIVAEPPYVVNGGVRYPIYLFEDDFELPTKGTYYVLTKTGLYLHKETKAGAALVPASGVPWLREPTMEFRLKLPKIPGRIIGQALTFFRKVFQAYKSEAYVTLLYSPKLNQYRLWCPTQKVSAGRVNYDRDDQVPPAGRNFKVVGAGINVTRQENSNVSIRDDIDWQMVGTIHSHCDFSAFHSGTDVGDEDTFDGIHITLGHVNHPQFSMEASISINKQREKLEPENCCTGVVRIQNKEVARAGFMTRGEANYFDLELTEEDAQQLVEDTNVINVEWMPKVEHQTFFYGGGKHVGSGKQGLFGVGDFDEHDYHG